MKVLHIVNGLNPGGVEKWLHDLVLNESVHDIHILKQNPSEGFFEKSLELNGAKISCIPKNKFFYYIRVIAYIKKQNPDVVHSHLHYSSGLYMLLSFVLGVKCRVTHSHIYTNEKGLGVLRRKYKDMMKIFIRFFSNVRIAVSELSGNCIFHENDFVILPCGIELNSQVQKKVINGDVPIRIGHIGRFSEEKNHELMFRVAKQLQATDVEFRMIFIGEGSLKQYFVDKSLEMGLTSYVEFKKPTVSVADFLTNDVDLFLFPSKFEGLGLSLIEAQYYGLPCIISSSIPKEAVFGNCYIVNVESEDAESKIVKVIKDKNYLEQSVSLEFIKSTIENSNINVRNNRLKLNELYRCGVS
ncbi:glycosyltransferase [Vibrio cyclitrophicus]